MLRALAISSVGCALEDGTAFGAPYVIAAEPAPRIEAGSVVFTASYKSPCAGGASVFEARRFGEDASDGAPAILQSSCMLVVYRHEPECASPLPFEEELTMEIRTPLPESASSAGLGNKMLACPPGSLYEMVKLQDAAATPRQLSFMTGLSTPTPPATKPLDWDEEEDGLWEPPAAAASSVAAASFADDSVGSDDPEEEATRVANVSGSATSTHLPTRAPLLRLAPSVHLSPSALTPLGIPATDDAGARDADARGLGQLPAPLRGEARGQRAVRVLHRPDGLGAAQEGRQRGRRGRRGRRQRERRRERRGARLRVCQRVCRCDGWRDGPGRRGGRRVGVGAVALDTWRV